MFKPTAVSFLSRSHLAAVLLARYRQIHLVFAAVPVTDFTALPACVSTLDSSKCEEPNVYTLRSAGEGHTRVLIREVSQVLKIEIKQQANKTMLSGFV